MATNILNIGFPSAYSMKQVCRIVLYMLCVASLFSCVKIDLCMENEHKHEGYIKAVYHWTEDMNCERPDSMFLLVKRMVNTQWTGYITGTETSVGGRYRFGKKYRDDDTIAVSVGEYNMFAFSSDTSGFRFDNLCEDANGEFLEAVGTHDLSVSYINYESNDPHIAPYGEDWIDFNPYAKYIATNVKPIYRAFNECDKVTQGIPFDVRIEEEVEVHLYPQKITQDITFVFPIYVDEQVGVDSIVAEISGIPHKMYICTGIVNVDTTYKMLFKFNIDKDYAKDTILQVQDKEIMTNKRFKRLDCISTISVLGLVPNENPTYSGGAGILQLCIHSHATDTNGDVKKKNLYAKINMHNTIKNAHLLITDEQGRIIQNPGTYSELKRTDTLCIKDSKLIITEDLVLGIYDDGYSLDNWVKVDEGGGRFEIEL